MLEKYGFNVTVKRNAWVDVISKATKEYDLILYALCRTVHSPIGPLEFWGDDAGNIWGSNAADREKTVIASFGSPYLYSRYYKNSDFTYINAYSYSKATIEAFVKAILGEIEFQGKPSTKL